MSFPLFINDLSCTSQCDNLSTAKSSAINFTRSIIHLSRKRKDLHIVHSEKISSLHLAGHSLCELLSGQDSREYWDRLRHSFIFIDDDKKYNYKERISIFEDNEFTTIDKKTCQGILRAYNYSSLTISFNIDAEHDKELINAIHYSLVTDKETNISVGNISKIDHIETHIGLIENYGIILSTSTLVYQGDNYVVHMYINDHNPPHIHVYDSNDKATLLARVNINNFDLMEGSEKVNSIKRDLMSWIKTNQDSLKKSWELCQKGEYPIRINP